jgi:hypothetical protein
MASLVGTRLRPCEILGAGGTAQIDRADDARLAPFRSGPLLLALLAVVSIPAIQIRAACAEPPGPSGEYCWRGVDGEPLPFQDHATIQDVMRQARVVSHEPIPTGVSGTRKLLLQNAEAKFHAAFRVVDRNIRVSPSADTKSKKFRDAAIFECAAYEVSQLLGLNRVPPVVHRRIGEQNGTVQIWLEGTRSEYELREQGQLRPPDLARWAQQRQIMYAFDSLIANSDRNASNVLLDRSWSMWLIDHTRAFGRSSTLLNRKRLKACERGMWESLRELDDDVLCQRLEPYLEHEDLSYLCKRRVKLVRLIEHLIDKHGEDAVLFDVRPAEGRTADWND